MANEVVMNILGWPKISIAFVSRKCIYKPNEYYGQYNRIEEQQNFVQWAKIQYEKFKIYVRNPRKLLEAKLQEI